jgi:hypothetical protein
MFRDTKKEKDRNYTNDNNFCPFPLRLSLPQGGDEAYWGIRVGLSGLA